MYARQDLPKLYHLDDQEPIKTKQEDKKTKKLSPAATSKLISTNELSLIMLNQDNEIDFQTKEKSNLDLDKSDEKLDTSDSKDNLSSKEDFSNKDECNNFQSSSQEKDVQHNQFLSTKKPNGLNISTLFEVISELKSNKSRVTKVSLEKCFQRRLFLPRTEINEFIRKCLNNEILEKIKYRDYQGVRIKASFKNGLKIQCDKNNFSEFETNESGSDKLSLNDKSSLNDKNSINDHETMSNLDNLSECSSNINALNELNEDLDDSNMDGTGFNTKKNALKRCSPTIRYLLRNAPEDGISACEMLKSLQSKRLLILYDLKKFIWLMKTYFIDRGNRITVLFNF